LPSSCMHILSLFVLQPFFFVHRPLLSNCFIEVYTASPLLSQARHLQAQRKSPQMVKQCHWLCFYLSHAHSFCKNLQAAMNDYALGRPVAPRTLGPAALPCIPVLRLVCCRISAL
jgi:hypothetical protein